jgi:hypothetical protein
MRGLLGAIAFLSACSLQPPESLPPPESLQPSPEPHVSPTARQGRPLRELTGEVRYDPAWPSAFRADGCLSFETSTGSFELVVPDGWMLDRIDASLDLLKRGGAAVARESGLRLLDANGTVVAREHHAAHLAGVVESEPARGDREAIFLLVATVPAPPPIDTLHVELTSMWGAGHDEGAVNMVRLLDADGDLLAQEPVPHAGSIGVPGDAQTVVSYQKPCSANCGMAYGFANDCNAPLAMEPGEETTMSVFFEHDGHCSLRFRSGPPAAVVGTLAMNRYDGARLPYPVDGACVLIDDRLVPVLPEGWTMRGHRESATVALIDPAGVTVANDGDLVWLNGTVTDTERPFDCDLGQLFEVSEVVMAEPPPG